MHMYGIHEPDLAYAWLTQKLKSLRSRFNGVYIIRSVGIATLHELLTRRGPLKYCSQPTRS